MVVKPESIDDFTEEEKNKMKKLESDIDFHLLKGPRTVEASGTYNFLLEYSGDNFPTKRVIEEVLPKYHEVGWDAKYELKVLRPEEYRVNFLFSKSVKHPLTSSQ